MLIKSLKMFIEDNPDIQITHNYLGLKNDMFQWEILIQKEGREYRTVFQKGLAHQGIKMSDGKWRMATWNQIQEHERQIKNGERRYHRYKPVPPTPIEFLENIQGTCRDIKTSPFWEDFAFDLGMNPDSIKERAIWKECVKLYRGIRDVMGYSKFREFLSCEAE